MITWLQKAFNAVVDEDTFRVACSFGRLDVVKYLATTYPHIHQSFASDWSHDFLAASIRSGNAALVLYLMKDLKLVPIFSSNLLINAIGLKNLDVVRVLHEGGVRWNPQETEGSLSSWKSPLDPAVSNRDRIMVKYLLDVGYSFGSSDCAGAVRTGLLSYMEWIFNMGCPLTEVAYLNFGAGTRPHRRMKEMVTWLKDHGAPFDSRAYKAAAQNSNLELLKMLKSLGCPYDASVYLFKATHFHFESAKWLRENLCPLVPTSLMESRMVRSSDLQSQKQLAEARPRPASSVFSFGSAPSSRIFPSPSF